MSKYNVSEILEAIKNKEVSAVEKSPYAEGDVVCIFDGISQTKSGVTKTILKGRLAVVVDDSKKAGKIRVILLDSKGNPQSSIVRVGVDEVVKYEEPEVEGSEEESNDAESTEEESVNAESTEDQSTEEEGTEEA
jgi:hypothetical protein